MTEYIAALAAKVKKEKDVFIAPTAVVIGDVFLGEEASVWFGAVIRGDTDKIRIGARTNIQDNCILHVDEGVPVDIGENVTVGHAAIVHGATIGSNTLIGMQAVVLNRAKIGEWCIIGAQALITEGMEIPDFSIVMGSPGKIVKKITAAHQERIKKNAENYIALAKKYRGVTVKGFWKGDGR